MSARIVSLEQARAARRPHEAGMASCRACGCTWLAVAPAGTQALECPRCGRAAGEWEIDADGMLESWLCLCGSSLFKVRKAGVFCAACGDEQFGMFDL